MVLVTLKLLRLTIFVLIFLFISSRVNYVYAVQSLNEEFDSTPSSQIWTSEKNNGTIEVLGGVLKLSAPPGRTFPFMYLNNAVDYLDENFIFETRLKLTGPLNFGFGVNLSDVLPLNGRTADLSWSEIVFLFWPIPSGKYLLYSTPCLDTDLSCSGDSYNKDIATMSWDDWHEVRITRSGNTYTAHLDGDFVFRSKPSAKVVSQLWLGNPQRTGGVVWGNLFIDYIRINASPTPTPTPTPTPSPTPEPTPEPLKPIIVLPGLGASWDFPAILGGTSGTNWSIPSFVNLYDNLISSLIKAGYEKDKNLFVFAYDWRKDLDSLATDLDDYIDSLVAQEEIAEGQKIDFVGHSYGGLVTRAYGQRVGTEKINKIVMAGSPHQGILDAYATWEGATVWKNIWWQKAALELQTQLNQRTGENRVDTVRRLTPGIKDVLPTFDFLKKDGVILLSSSLNQKNTTLANLNSNIGLIDNLVNVNGGNGKTTDRFVKITQRGWLDRTLGLWEDGKPISDDPFETSTEGDDSVLSISSLGNFTNKKTVSADHGGVVNDSVAIGNIFDQLGLDKTKVLTNVIPDQRKNVFIAALRSPGSVSVCDTENICDENLGIYLDEEKIFLLPGYNDGDLNVMVVGQGETGSYRLHLGDLADDSAAWETVSGKLESGNQVDQYDFSIEEGEIKISVQEEVMQRSLDELYRQLNSLWPNWDKKNLFATVQSGSATKNKRVMAIRQLRELLASLAIKAYKERKIDRVEMIMVFWKELDRHAELVIGTGNSTKVSMLNANISLVGGYKVLAENLLRNSTSLPAGNFYLLFSRRFDEAKDIRSINRDLSLDKTLSARYLLQTALGVR